MKKRRLCDSGHSKEHDVLRICLNFSAVILFVIYILVRYDVTNPHVKKENETPS